MWSLWSTHTHTCTHTHIPPASHSTSHTHTYTPHSIPSAAVHQPKSRTAAQPKLCCQSWCLLAAGGNLFPLLTLWGSHVDCSTCPDESWATSPLQSHEDAAGRELGRQRCAGPELPRAGPCLPILNATPWFLSPCRVSLAWELGSEVGEPTTGMAVLIVAVLWLSLDPGRNGAWTWRKQGRPKPGQTRHVLFVLGLCLWPSTGSKPFVPDVTGV